MSIEGISSIPVYSYPDVKMTVRISGISYGLRFRANSEHDSVSLEISDAEGNNIICGIKVVAGINLIGGVNVAGMPSGSIFFINKNYRERVSAFGYSEEDYILIAQDRYDDIAELVEAL